LGWNKCGEGRKTGGCAKSAAGAVAERFKGFAVRSINVWKVGNICKGEVTAEITRLVWLQDKMWIVCDGREGGTGDKGVDTREWRS
jgi:hypothetical protein